MRRNAFVLSLSGLIFLSWVGLSGMASLKAQQENIYGYKKKGLRFPSKFLIKEEYIRRVPSRIKISEMKISCKNYKFFVVETEVKY